MADTIGAGMVYLNNCLSSATSAPVALFKPRGDEQGNDLIGLDGLLQVTSVWLNTSPDIANPFPQE